VGQRRGDDDSLWALAHLNDEQHKKACYIEIKLSRVFYSYIHLIHIYCCSFVYLLGVFIQVNPHISAVY
jgi:hypothetical protein